MRLPADIAERMVFYGKFEFRPAEAGPGAAERVNAQVYQALYPMASSDPHAFVSALAAAVLPIGGWAVYGGQRCVRDLISGRAQTQHPGYVAMVDMAMEFLRSTGCGPAFVAPVELEVWRQLHPDTEW